MAFPSLTPTGRTFEPGTYPIKTFRSQSGAESRILYGTKRVEQALSLTYTNITDTEAEQFITHFDEVLGSFSTFSLPTAVKNGWRASSATIDAVSGAAWRYESPPSIASVRPGRSTVQVKLVAVV